MVGPSKKGPDVHWKKVNKLKTGQPYINYTGVIEKERLPTISPFTDVVRETSSSICVIVASCHMTSQYFLSHDTHHPITFTILCYYYYTQYTGALYAKLPGEGYQSLYFEPQPDLPDQLCEWQRMLKAMTE